VSERHVAARGVHEAVPAISSWSRCAAWPRSRRAHELDPVCHGSAIFEHVENASHYPASSWRASGLVPLCGVLDIRGMMAAAAGVPLVRHIQLHVPCQSAGLG
jgi:hypothetical protein